MKAGENADPISLVSGLLRFRQGGEWDLQRLETGKVDPKYVDYSTVAIGLYAAGAGLPRESILDFQNAYAAAKSNFAPGTKKDPVYTSLPVRNVMNTDFGYEIYSKGPWGR